MSIFKFPPVVLKAGEAARVEEAGRWFYMYDCEGIIELRFEMVRPDGSSYYEDANIKARRGGLVGDFKRVYLTSDVDQTVDVGISQQPLMDNETSYTGAVLTTPAASELADDLTISVGIAAVEVAPANTRRGALLLQNHGDTEVWVAPDNGVDPAADHGIKVGSGQPFSVTWQGAVWARRATGLGNVYTIEEARA